MDDRKKTEEARYILSSEEQQALLEGIESETTEPVVTFDEAVQFAKDQRKAWVKSQNPRSA